MKNILNRHQQRNNIIENHGIQSVVIPNSCSSLQFEILRGKLEEAGNRLGFLDPEVLFLSQELDVIHNQIMNEQLYQLRSR